MAFEGLSEKLGAVFKRLKSRGKLTEADVKEAMREVRLALLEADVNYKVVKDFVAKVSERAVGEEVLGSLTPGQQVIKIVNEELIALMGGKNEKATLIYRWVYIAAIFIGPYLTVSAVWTSADIFNGLMAFPNLVALILLSGIVSKETKDFLERLHNGHVGD